MAFTLNRRLAQLVDSNGQLNAGKIPDNEITQAKLHSSFTVTASHLGTSLTPTFGNTTVGSRLTFSSNSHYLETGTNAVAIKSSGGNVYLNATNAGTTINNGLSVNGLLTANNGLTVTGNITTTGYLAGPSTFTIDPATVGDNTGTVVIAGNLQVDGTTTTINSTTMTVDDLNLTLASGAANSSAANGAGITIDGASASLVWEHANDQFKFNKTIGADVNVASSNFLGDANIYALRLTNDDTTAGNTVGITFGQGGFDFTNFIASVRTGTGSDPKGDLVFGGRPSDGSSFVERMRIEAGGDIGIGTSSPDTKLHVFKASAGSITDYTNNALIVENSTDVGISLLTPNSAAGHLMFGSPGHQYHSYIRGQYGANNTSTLKFFTDGNNTMTHKNDRVGIGTDNPLSTVDVRDGNIMLGGYGGGGDYGVIFTPADSSSYWHIYNDTGGELVFGRNITIGSTEFARFDSTGKLGLGVTDPQHQLDISDTISAKIRLGGGTNQNGIRFNAAGNDGVTSSAYYLGVGSDLMSGTDYGAVLLDITNNRSVLYDDQSNSRLGFYNNSIVINSSGNVGIGHTSSFGKLSINSNGQPASSGNMTTGLTVSNGTGGTAINIGTYDSGGYNYIQSAYVNNAGVARNLVFLTGSSERMRIDTSGNVGIGTNSPTKRLQIRDTTQTNQSIHFGPHGAAYGEINYNSTGLEHLYIDCHGTTSGYGNIVFRTGPDPAQVFKLGADGYATFTSTRSEYAMELNSAGTRAGLVLNKPGTSTVMGSLLMLSNEEYRLGTASYYHINMTQTGKTWFGNNTRYGHFDVNGNLNFEHGGVINFEAASNDYSTVYSATGYSSQGYSSSQRYWNHLISKGGTHITINSDGGHTASENGMDDFVIWQGTQDTAEPLFRVSNTGRVVAKQNYEIGNHKTNREEFGVNAINTVDTATSDINTTVTNTYENRAGVYWLNFNSKRFRAFVQPQWLQGRNWVLAAKFFHFSDMPSGSSLWTNDTSWNGGDFDLNNGHFSKYGKVWRYFGFTRLAMQMGNRIAPIMQFNSTQTLYGAFSGGRANNGGGVTANSTDPQIANNATYHGMSNFVGPNFTNLGGAEDIMQSYGLNKWANNSTNSTSGNNHGSADGNSDVSEGFQLTVEDAHPHLQAVDSVGRAGAWIGCPLDEGGYTFGGASSNGGADSGFGFGGCTGNYARTWTSGVAEWGKGNEVANYLPAYIWLSID